MLLVFPFLGSIGLAGEQSAAMNSIVNGNTAFALDLYSMLKKEKGNLFFSPYSISSALAMIYGGARGDTAEEIAKTLHFTLGEEKTHPAFAELNATFEKIRKKGSVQLNIANSLWPQKDRRFLPRYLSLMKRYYGVSVTPVDYAKEPGKASDLINAWVEKRTKGKIKDIIRQEDLDPATVLVLVNAIYFKGKWASQFDPKRTAESDFSLLSGGKARVPMMHRTGRYGYGEIKGAQLLELPYMGKELSMILILPSEPTQFSKLEDQLTPGNLDFWLSQIHEEQVNVYLPRFKVTWGVHDLIKPMQALGVRKPFDTRADFSGMDGTRTHFVSLLLHKAFVEVNEEGTEAAAATAGGMMLTAVPIIRTFRANHPFMFAIRDNTTGSILFLGRILDPASTTA